jgi:ArsR family transcriptional regulator, virulence genes transcriptional regulator
MKLQGLEARTRSNNLSRMVDNAGHASDFLKALAHEGRLTILCILAEGEKSVTELEELLSIRQAALSQQLARLRANGLVSTRRNGKMIYYNLASDEARVVINAMYDMFCHKKSKR